MTRLFIVEVTPFWKSKQDKNTKIWFQRHVLAMLSKQAVHLNIKISLLLTKNYCQKNEHVLTTLLFCCWIIASEEKDETQNGSKSSQMFCVWIIYFVSRSYLVQVSKPAKSITIYHTPPFFLWFSFGYPISIRNMIV